LAAVQDAFGAILFVVVIVAAVISVGTLVASRRSYDEIGRGGLSLRDGSDRPAGAETTPAQRDEEIRQMLEARSARRARQGRPALDVEAELAALTDVRVDPELEVEVRQLVEARNARRVRQGRAPLDVEAEVARQLRALGE